MSKEIQMTTFGTKIKISVLEKAIKWLVGGEAFNDITKLVNSLMTVDKTNDEKRKIVKEAVMPYLTAIGKFILNTAIAFAVDKAKAEIAKVK